MDGGVRLRKTPLVSAIVSTLREIAVISVRLWTSAVARVL